MKEEITKATTTKRQGTRRNNKKCQWWDRDCPEWKKELKRKLTKCASGEGLVKDYGKKKREYKYKRTRKKKDWVDKWTKQIKRDRTEKAMWKAVNQRRKKRSEVNEEITDREWKEHFKT